MRARTVIPDSAEKTVRDIRRATRREDLSYYVGTYAKIHTHYNEVHLHKALVYRSPCASCSSRKSLTVSAHSGAITVGSCDPVLYVWFLL
jgi:hypothetical protein